MDSPVVVMKHRSVNATHPVFISLFVGGVVHRGEQSCVLSVDIVILMTHDEVESFSFWDAFFLALPDWCAFVHTRFAHVSIPTLIELNL